MTANHRIRALFLDLDGTLIDHTETISSGILSELARVNKLGCEVVACTGRTRFTAEHIIRQFPFEPRYVVTSNGGAALDLCASEPIMVRRLDIHEAHFLVGALVEAGITPYVYEDAVVPGVEYARVLYPHGHAVGPFAHAPRYRPQVHIHNSLPFHPISVSAFGPATVLRPLAAALIKEIGDHISVIQSGSGTNWGIELFSHGVNKCEGMKVVLRRLGLQQHETMAIGDHFNDIEMLQWAHIGVAMGNAQPEIMAIAQHTAPDLAHDGAAWAIRQFIRN